MNSNLILKKERRKERPKAISGECRAGSCLYHINRSVEKISEGLDHQFTRRSEREIFEKKTKGLTERKKNCLLWVVGSMKEWPNSGCRCVTKEMNRRKNVERKKGRKYLFEMAGHASNASQLASESKR